MHAVQCMGVSVATAYRSLLDLRKQALNSKSYKAPGKFPFASVVSERTSSPWYCWYGAELHTCGDASLSGGHMGRSLVVYSIC
jgi:hypothetical protein